MASFVLEFSSASAEDCAEALRLLVSAPNLIAGLRADDCLELRFEVPFNDLTQAMHSIACNDVVAVSFADGVSARSFVYAPYSCGWNLRQWLTSREMDSEVDARREFDELLRLGDRSVGGLNHISLSREEPLDLDQLENIDRVTFPWAHWRLLAAAVRDNGSWVVSPSS